MKAHRILLAGLFVVFSACESLFVDRAGETIQFGATAENGALTKTSYSGYVDPNGKERIDWNNGDIIKIYMYYEDPKNQNNPYDDIAKDYVVVNIEEQYEKSIGKVATDDPLVWGTGNSRHEFFGVYPADFGGSFLGFDRQNYQPYYKGPLSFEFHLPAKQDGSMKYAYMAATSAEQYYTTEGKGSVILQFYPMVTTLWFRLKNDSTTDITINSIKVSTRQEQGGSWSHKPVAGTFSAILNNREFVTNDNDDNSNEKSVIVSVNKSIGVGDIVEIPAFIRPKTYDTSLIDLTINFSQGGVYKEISNCLGENKSDITKLLPRKKYNIGINLSGNGVTIDPPTESEPGRLKPAAAQIILSILKDGGGNNWSYEDFADFFKKYFGFNDQNDFNNKFWNDHDGEKGFNSALEEALKDLETISSFLDKWFPGSKLDGLLAEMAKLEEVSLGEGTPGFLLDIIEEEDFSKFFPNVKTIRIKTPHDITITLYNLDELEKIVFEGGYDVNVKIILVNCPDNITIDPGNNYKVTVERITTS